MSPDHCSILRAQWQLLVPFHVLLCCFPGLHVLEGVSDTFMCVILFVIRRTLSTSNDMRTLIVPLSESTCESAEHGTKR